MRLFYIHFMKIPELYKLYIKYPKICTDSREAVKNSLFFGLKGENFNGNKFAAQALQECNYAIIDDVNYYVNKKTIIVKDSLDTLQKLAQYHINKLNIPVIAITGTNGKTTTKELIRNVLSKKYDVVATRENLNNHIGVPLTLLEMNNSTEIGIVEIGANHLNEISNLCKITKPGFGIITNIGRAHLEGFGSFENIIKAKSELYQYLIKNKGIIFKNSRYKILNSLSNNYQTIDFSTENIEINQKSLFLSFIYNESKITTNLVGSYNLENVLAAICIGNYFQVDFLDIKTAVESYKPLNIRSQFIKTKNNSLILDSYNANPSSMDLSIRNFAELRIENKMLILGDMYELGSESGIEHEKVINLVKQLNFSKVLFVGKDFYNFSENYNFDFFKYTDSVISWFNSTKITGKNILIKGSRGMKLEMIAEYL